MGEGEVNMYACPKCYAWNNHLNYGQGCACCGYGKFNYTTDSKTTMKDLDPDIVKMVNENFWDLLPDDKKNNSEQGRPEHKGFYATALRLCAALRSFFCKKFQTVFLNKLT